MMNRNFMVTAMLVALAACQSAIPDSGAGVADPGRGVGFDRPIPGAETAALTRQAGQIAPTAQAGPRAVHDPQGLDSELAGNADRQDADAARANSGEAVLQASPSNAPPVLLNNPGISDENSFDAVSGRESIESDAARIAENRQQYQLVQPSALPARSGNSQPNVVEYALQTRHPKGTQMHRRLRIFSASRFQRNCAKYASADEAQIDFLARGGPGRDRRGLDPDGDGYACAWDPAPFRYASGQ